ncbi:MAG: fluoride efflux transporter FluC [Acidimicrobiales bacterium]
MTGTMWVGFALAAAAGAVCRHLVWKALVDHRRPAERASVAVNTAGSLLFGILVGWGMHGGLSADVVLIVGVGFCGSLTTMSGSLLDVVTVTDRGGPLPGGAYLGVSVGAPIAAAAFGLVVASALVG